MDHQGSGSRPDAAFVALQHPTRRVLGDVSPNVRAMNVSKAPNDKPSAGTPLKRTMSAALNDGTGFTYLKRRKLSSENAPRSMEMSSHKEISSLDVSHAESQPDSVTVNTPARSDEDGEDVNSSIERQSFSSLINYEPSSQNATSYHTQPKLLFRGPSCAEILKLRLQMAMYKIRTNQIDVPFDDLRENKPPPPPPNYAEAEQAVAALRAEAQLRDINRSHAHPSATPIFPPPTLRPTEYSSRLIYGRSMPSSPLPAGSICAPGSITPAQIQTGRRPEDELTSSIVKGRVAEGLLHLRHGA